MRLESNSTVLINELDFFVAILSIYIESSIEKISVLTISRAWPSNFALSAVVTVLIEFD